MATLGLAAVKQVLIYAKKTYTVEEEEQIIKKIEESAKKYINMQIDVILS